MLRAQIEFRDWIWKTLTYNNVIYHEIKRLIAVISCTYTRLIENRRRPVLDCRNYISLFTGKQ